MNDNRAGYFVKQPSGYKSFVPKKLPPEPAIIRDEVMDLLLSDADRKLGVLEGITQILPDPDLFVAMYVQKEAVLSSQIEGTQASLSDVLGAGDKKEKREDIVEIVNYVAALNYGLDRMKELPLSLRLIREIHKVLLRKGRGSNRNPGEFRTTQNWIGPQGCTLNTATYVPPAVPEMKTALSDLELFLHDEKSYIPPLIKIALIHSQFESIHPFIDGNGRMGRLLITFWLCQQKILSQPLLYLSYYFKLNRQEYYDRLMDVRTKGQWENWIKFFLKGISFISDESTQTAKDIISLKAACERALGEERTGNYAKLLDFLFNHPIITKKEAEEELKVSYPTASRILDDFVRRGLLAEKDPAQKRNKQFSFAKYITLLNRGTEI